MSINNESNDYEMKSSVLRKTGPLSCNRTIECLKNDEPLTVVIFGKKAKTDDEPFSNLGVEITRILYGEEELDFDKMKYRREYENETYFMNEFEVVALEAFEHIVEPKLKS